MSSKVKKYYDIFNKKTIKDEHLKIVWLKGTLNDGINLCLVAAEVDNSLGIIVHFTPFAQIDNF